MLSVVYVLAGICCNKLSKNELRICKSSSFGSSDVKISIHFNKIG